MAVGLFIQKKDLKRYTVVDANLDENVYLPIVELAQETHIQKLLGTTLYEKIRTDIESSSLAGDYLTLVNKYLNKATIFYTMVELVPIAGWNLSNNGLGKRVSELKEQSEDSDVDLLERKYRDLAEHYANLCRKYIKENISSFPEYNSNDAEDIYPESDTFSTNWEF